MKRFLVFRFFVTFVTYILDVPICMECSIPLQYADTKSKLHRHTCHIDKFKITQYHPMEYLYQRPFFFAKGDGFVGGNKEPLLFTTRTLFRI